MNKAHLPLSGRAQFEICTRSFQSSDNEHGYVYHTVTETEAERRGKRETNDEGNVSA